MECFYTTRHTKKERPAEIAVDGKYRLSTANLIIDGPQVLFANRNPKRNTAQIPGFIATIEGEVCVEFKKESGKEFVFIRNNKGRIKDEINLDSFLELCHRQPLRDSPRKTGQHSNKSKRPTRKELQARPRQRRQARSRQKPK